MVSKTFLIRACNIRRICIDLNCRNTFIPEHFAIIFCIHRFSSHPALVEFAVEAIDKYEQTLILLKPDAVQRKLVGKIIERFESRGLELVGMKLILVSN